MFPATNRQTEEQTNYLQDFSKKGFVIFRHNCNKTKANIKFPKKFESKKVT